MSKKVVFIKSAVVGKDFPVHSLPEIAFAGRSNAGKSSLINVILNHAVAKVSQTPGKTRLLNFFRVNEDFVLVDMPGYGYASRSGDEQRDWRSMIETYLTTRGQLRGMVLVMDIRRSWEAEEELLKKFANMISLPMVVALTKSDKLSQSQILQATNKIKKKSGISAVFPVSSLNKKGQIELDVYIYNNLIKKKVD